MPEPRQSSGVDLIDAERERQVADEHWTPEHDDKHGDGSMAVAAACYAMPQPLYVERRYAGGVHYWDPWPWRDSEDKRKVNANHTNHIPDEGQERVRMLVRAGALIAAEIDRLHRAGCQCEGETQWDQRDDGSYVCEECGLDVWATSDDQASHGVDRSGDA